VLDQCVGSVVKSASWEMLDYFDLYQAFKQWPDGKPVVEQWAAVVDAFRIFQHEIRALYPMSEV
jgi:hypothetical protein